MIFIYLTIFCNLFEIHFQWFADFWWLLLWLFCFLQHFYCFSNPQPKKNFFSPTLLIFLQFFKLNTVRKSSAHTCTLYGCVNVSIKPHVGVACGRNEGGVKAVLQLFCSICYCGGEGPCWRGSYVGAVLPLCGAGLQRTIEFFLQHFATFLTVMTTFLQTPSTFIQVSYPTLFRNAFVTPPLFGLYERLLHPPPYGPYPARQPLHPASPHLPGPTHPPTRPADPTRPAIPPPNRPATPTSHQAHTRNAGSKQLLSPGPHA